MVGRVEGSEGTVGAIVATIAGSFLVRVGGAATGVMLGILLAHLHRAGAAGTSAMAVSLLAAAFYLSELVGAPFAGLLSDRRGAQVLLLAGPILGILAELLFANPSHLALLTVARLLQGLTTACTIPAALAFISDASARDTRARGQTMGFFEVGSIGGLAAGNVVGGFLWDGAHRFGFALLGGVYLLAVVVFLLIRFEHAPKPERPPRATWRAIRHAGDLVPSWLALNAAAGVWFGHAAYQFSGADPRRHQLLTFGLADETIGVVFGVYILLFALGTVGWGTVLNRVQVSRAMRIGVVGLFLSSLALLGINHAGQFGGTWFSVAIALGILSLGLETAFTPAALTLLADRSDQDSQSRGAVMGVYSMLLGAGQLLGGILGGVFAMGWGVDGLIALTAILALIAALTLPKIEVEGLSRTPRIATHAIDLS